MTSGPEILFRYRDAIEHEVGHSLTGGSSSLDEMLRSYFGWTEAGLPSLAKCLRPSLCLMACEALGGKLTDVVRTRIFVSDISQWEAVGRVHGEVFADVRPATTMVEVSKLIDGAALVEIEADAIVV